MSPMIEDLIENTPSGSFRRAIWMNGCGEAGDRPFAVMPRHSAFQFQHPIHQHTLIHGS
jgi:hypothetical protein